jgi:membrane-bound metal-dependent hydrolase YbcI (DUF457 family)
LHGWALAQFLEERRDRAIVAIAAVIPDLDGLGAVPELLTRNSPHPLLWFSNYHHLLTHNVWAALCTTVVALLLARRRAATALFTLLSFHLHLLGDLMGSRGPDGYSWPIKYLYPFSAREWNWSGQWQLASWQNLIVTLGLMAIAAAVVVVKRRSPAEMFSASADAAVVNAVQTRLS